MTGAESSLGAWHCVLVTLSGLKLIGNYFWYAKYNGLVYTPMLTLVCLSFASAMYGLQMSYRMTCLISAVCYIIHAN